jgi:hypothetical protein
MTGNKNNQGENEQIRERLLQASTWDEVSQIRKDLIADGSKAGTIDAVISQLRRKGLLPPKVAVARTQRALARREALPAEYLIDMMEVPGDANMCRGYKLGQLNLLAAARLLQELGKIQAEQVNPVINLVQALRLEEKSAAEAARGEGRMIADEAAEGLAARILPALDQRLGQLQPQKADIAQSPHPMQGLFARMMERLMENLMGQVVPGARETASLPPGWEDGGVEETWR